MTIMYNRKAEEFSEKQNAACKKAKKACPSIYGIYLMYRRKYRER